MGLPEDLATAAIDAVYAVYGMAASYVPPGGGPSVPCSVLLDIRDSNSKPDDGSPPAGQATIEVRASEIAQPAAEGVFTMAYSGRVFTVASRPLPKDADGANWTMWVEQ